MTMVMKSYPIGQFKARCLRLMEEVRTKREPILITKRGRPLARVVPTADEPRDVFGCLADVLEIVGDVESPVVEPRKWSALK
jgi:prevent-host-death family protein